MLTHGAPVERQDGVLTQGAPAGETGWGVDQWCEFFDRTAAGFSVEYEDSAARHFKGTRCDTAVTEWRE